MLGRMVRMGPVFVLSLQALLMKRESFDFRGNGVIILNFIGDVLANLFLSGMFVRR